MVTDDLRREDLNLARDMKDLDLSAAKKGTSGSSYGDFSVLAKVSVLGLHL